MSTRYLWVQQKVLEKAAEILKVPGKTNPADVGTKPVSACRFQGFREACGTYGDVDVSCARALREVADAGTGPAIAINFNVSTSCIHWDTRGAAAQTGPYVS